MGNRAAAGAEIETENPCTGSTTITAAVATTTVEPRDGKGEMPVMPSWVPGSYIKSHSWCGNAVTPTPHTDTQSCSLSSFPVSILYHLSIIITSLFFLCTVHRINSIRVQYCVPANEEVRTGQEESPRDRTTRSSPSCLPRSLLCQRMLDSRGVY